MNWYYEPIRGCSCISSRCPELNFGMPTKIYNHFQAAQKVPCIDRHYIGLNTKDIIVFESAFATYVRGYDVKGKLLYPNRDALVSALMPRFQQPDFHCELVSRVYHDRGVIDEEHLFFSGKPFQAIWIYFEVVEDEITMFQYLKVNDLNAHACL